MVRHAHQPFSSEFVARDAQQSTTGRTELVKSFNGVVGTMSSVRYKGHQRRPRL